jgi:hypothetical protein
VIAVVNNCVGRPQVVQSFAAFLKSLKAPERFDGGLGAYLMHRPAGGSAARVGMQGSMKPFGCVTMPSIARSSLGDNRAISAYKDHA